MQPFLICTWGYTRWVCSRRSDFCSPFTVGVRGCLNPNNRPAVPFAFLTLCNSNLLLNIKNPKNHLYKHSLLWTKHTGANQIDPNQVFKDYRVRIEDQELDCEVDVDDLGHSRQVVARVRVVSVIHTLAHLVLPTPLFDVKHQIISSAKRPAQIARRE